MTHEMKLTIEPFNLIKNNKKSIEIRLFDKKREKLSIWDNIIFTNTSNKEDKIKVKIIWLLRYNNFENLFNNIEINKFWAKNINDLLNWVYKYYTKEDEKKYWVLWIHLDKNI